MSSAMQCSEFRKQAGADPQHLSAEVQAHCAQCAACTAYLQQMLRLDGLLKRALDVPVPVTPNNVTALRRESPSTVRHWYALAASLLLAVMLGAGIWLISPRESLAAEVVAHLHHEPGTMVATAARVNPAELDEVLLRAGVRLKTGSQKVSLARTCVFREATIPHLVVQTQEGPITVLVLPHEQVDSPQSFNEEGYAGTILPSGRGSIAIVANSSAAVQQAAAELAEAVVWLD
jgi:ferric-dicitrate binding protein FerR (iron transport regulator)